MLFWFSTFHLCSRTLKSKKSVKQIERKRAGEGGVANVSSTYSQRSLFHYQRSKKKIIFYAFMASQAQKPTRPLLLSKRSCPPTKVFFFIKHPKKKLSDD
jgi:hypothetical protein